jgi:hypothetical protein
VVRLDSSRILVMGSVRAWVGGRGKWKPSHDSIEGISDEGASSIQ